MTEHWRPLGIETNEQVEEYEALVEGVPAHLAISLWEWIKVHLTTRASQTAYSVFNVAEVQRMQRVLRLPPQYTGRDIDQGVQSLSYSLRGNDLGVLGVVDYLLSQRGDHGNVLDALLEESGSAWTVGERAGKPALVRRVPEGVQAAVEHVASHTAGLAGSTLREAWEALYGVSPNPSVAYSKAIKSVEHAAIPVVMPNDTTATLGKVIGQMASDGDWTLPMDQEHHEASTGDVLVKNMRVLWHGQHDRHGGQPSQPGKVSAQEAEVAVMVTVQLVQWFSSNLVQRRP